MTVLHIDFETFSACNLKVAGLYPYWEHSTTGIHCMGWAFDDDPWEVTDPNTHCVPDISIHIAGGGAIVAHNAPFEFLGLCWLARKYPSVWPMPKIEQFACTMAQSYALALPASLGHVAAALALKEGKDDEGAQVMLELCKPIPEVKVRKPRARQLPK